MKRFSAGVDPIDLLKEREGILTLLPQTSPAVLQKQVAKYTIDPKTRYKNVSSLVPAGDVSHLYDQDDSVHPSVENSEETRHLDSHLVLEGSNENHSGLSNYAN